MRNNCRHIHRMTRELDIANGTWLTNPFDDVGRYSDDVLNDWRTYGTPVDKSLHDYTNAYVREINYFADRIPERSFCQDDFTCTVEHGMAPKSIYPPKIPPPYNRGDGHFVVPDMIKHPLISHIINDNCSPSGLKSHADHGYTFESVQPPPKSHVPTYDIKQLEKEDAIYDMVRDLEPEAAYVKECHGRHDILMYNADSINAFSRADSIQDKFNTPVGCLVLKSDMLLKSGDGNDAKKIIRKGKRITGTLSTMGPTKPPRPAALSVDSIMRNLDANGFEIGVHHMPAPSKYVRPEYTLVAAQFSSESRWYLSAVPILLCHKRLDWSLMMSLARTYNFTGTLHGILKEMADCGYAIPHALDFLRKYGIEPIDTEPETIMEVLRVYKPPIPCGDMQF